jgi:hypothetical protein
MGAGASAGVSAAVASADDNEIKSMLTGLSEQDRQKLRSFLSEESSAGQVGAEPAAFLQAHGVLNPSTADLAYMQEQGTIDVVSRFIQTIIKMKPLDMNRFGTDYFSEALKAQKRLVLVSSDVADLETFKASVRSVGDQGAPIVTAVYDFEGQPSDFSCLLNELKAEHGTFKTVCMCCHGIDGGNPSSDEGMLTEKENADFKMKVDAAWEENGKPCLADGSKDYATIFDLKPELDLILDSKPEKWFPLKNHGVDLAGAADPGMDQVIQTMADASSVRIDILACSLAATQAGKDWLARWEKETKINFTASTNVTGNPEHGGDWVMETDGVNVEDVYFHRDKIKKWEVTLLKGEAAFSNPRQIKDHKLRQAKRAREIKGW